MKKMLKKHFSFSFLFIYLFIYVFNFISKTRKWKSLILAIFLVDVANVSTLQVRINISLKKKSVGNLKSLYVKRCGQVLISDWYHVIIMIRPPYLCTCYSRARAYPAGIGCHNDVVSMSMRRHHAASTLIRRHFTSCARWVLRLQWVRVGVVWTFLISSILSLLFLPLFGRRPDIEWTTVSKGR